MSLQITVEISQFESGQHGHKDDLIKYVIYRPEGSPLNTWKIMVTDDFTEDYQGDVDAGFGFEFESEHEEVGFLVADAIQKFPVADPEDSEDDSDEETVKVDLDEGPIEPEVGQHTE